MISLRARLLFFVVRISGLKDRLMGDGVAEKFLARDHARGPAKPIRWLRKNCEVIESDIDGHRLYELKPDDSGSKMHIFYLHGGGYAFNIVILHWYFIKKLIRKTGASFTVPLYPLSPEHKWDQSYDMVMQAYDQAAEKYGVENIIVMGDSAGGGFSLGLTQMLRNQGKTLPSKLVLLSPYLDQTASDPAQAELEKKDIMVSIEGIRKMGRWWVRDGESPAIFPVSPLFEPVDKLPPMQIFAGSDEMLLSDSLRLKEKGDAAGADMELHEYGGMQHVWMLLPIREAKQAIAQIVAFIKD